MRAIVTGATGFLGENLIALLHSRKWEVIGLGRNIPDNQQNATPHPELRYADITKIDTLRSAFEHVDVVFHCAALSDVWGSYKTFEKTNVEGTRNVVACASEFNCRRIVHVSSTSLYFNFQDRFNISETAPINGPFANAYAETKYLAERVVLEESSIGLERVVIRPRAIVGSGDTAIVPRILRIARKGWFPLISEGRATIDVTHVENVAHAMLLAANAENVNGECFNISNDEPTPVRELLQRIFDSQGLEVRLIRAPYFLVIKVAGIIEAFAKTFGLNEPSITRYGVGLIAKSQTLNIDKAKKLLGYRPQVSLNEAIDSYKLDKHAQANGTEPSHV